jgi:RNA polymerase sigma-70 factor (ECF subfamily)
MQGVAAKHERAGLGSRPPPEGAPEPEPWDFEAIYDAHFDFVWRSLRRLGVPEPAVEDATQDVFVVVYRRLGDFEGRSQVRTWLFGIALRVARSHRRRLARKGHLDPLPAELASEGEGPEREVEKRRAAHLLDRFLDALDEDKRAVFVLAEMEQMTAPEIQAALGVKLNTVYSRLRAARKAFEDMVRRHLAREERVASTKRRRAP